MLLITSRPGFGHLGRCHTNLCDWRDDMRISLAARWDKMDHRKGIFTERCPSRLKEHDWKSCRCSQGASGVRIPPSPPRSSGSFPYNAYLPAPARFPRVFPAFPRSRIEFVFGETHWSARLKSHLPERLPWPVFKALLGADRSCGSVNDARIFSLADGVGA